MRCTLFIARCGRWRGCWLLLALCLYLIAADREFFVQQLQLQVAQLFAARTILGNALLAKPLFQHLNLQPCVCQLFPLRLQLLLQLRDDLGHEGIRVRRNGGLRGRAHDAF